MPGRIRAILALVALAACSGAAPADDALADDAPADDAPARERLTRQQRDSIVGASALPGAGAVQRARDASDAMAERAARLDSLQR